MHAYTLKQSDMGYQKNLFTEITSGKIVHTSMIYISEDDIGKCCLKEVY
jgi:hypothetical protein